MAITIQQDRYPCFYTPECRARAALIVRNHIVRDKIYVDDAAMEKGGLYSINGRFFNLGEPNKDNYTVDGNNIISENSFSGGILYKINGVIANPRELASVQYAEYAYAPAERVTTTEKVIPDPACGTKGCPDAKTTTVIRPAPFLYPAQ